VSENKETKVFGKGVIITLGIICIILTAIIAYFIVTGISAQNSYNTLQNQNKQLQANNTNLQDQLNNLNNTLNLGKSIDWVDDQTVNLGFGSYNWTFSADYAGYVVVNVLSSSYSSNNSVEVVYSSNGVNYDSLVTVGHSGTASFAVLPSGSIKVTVDDSNPINSASIIFHTAIFPSATVTITYYF
jgi:hypothetical protein